jgi:hypothetical protein
VKYILMMNAPKEGWDEYKRWPKQVLEANIAFMRSFSKELREAGELVSAEGLAWPDQAKLVRAGAHGEPVTDGVFPESKEFLAGYWIVNVASPERAYELAAKASAAPSPSAEGRQDIEVRQVMSGPPEDLVR